MPPVTRHHPNLYGDAASPVLAQAQVAAGNTSRRERLKKEIKTLRERAEKLRQAYVFTEQEKIIVMDLDAAIRSKEEKLLQLIMDGM